MMDILILTRDVQQSDNDDRIIDTLIILSYAIPYKSLADPYHPVLLLDFCDRSNGTYVNSNEIYKLGRDYWEGLSEDPISSSRIIKTKIRLKLCDRGDDMNMICEDNLTRDSEEIRSTLHRRSRRRRRTLFENVKVMKVRGY